MSCRFALDPLHVCANRDGRTPPRLGTDCFAEAAAQLRDAFVVTDEALDELLQRAGA